MGTTDILWLFFILTALQPALKQKLLVAARQKAMARIEKERGSRVILLVHRQETMSLLGFPLFRFIDINDSEEVIRAIHMTDDDLPLDIVLHTPGGLVLAATQIARALHRHKGKTTVYVPHYAMSGGTLISLAADEIVMCEHAVLGPVDPQLGQQPAASVLKVLEQKSIDEIDDSTLILADQANKAITQVRDTVKELLSDDFPADKADELARLLSEGTWTHDYPITPREAKELGLNVNTEMPDEILSLLQLYPQPQRRLPSVEYVPQPYRSNRGRTQTDT